MLLWLLLLLLERAVAANAPHRHTAVTAGLAAHLGIVPEKLLVLRRGHVACRKVRKKI